MNDTVQALINVFPRIIPECILVAVACVLYLGGTFRACYRTWGIVALIGLVGAAVALFFTKPVTFADQSKAEAALFASPIFVDQMAIVIKWISIFGGIALVLLSWTEMSRDYVGEHHGSLLMIVAGLCFTASANDLVVLFLGLELVSIPTYLILYLIRSDKQGQEAGVKYFLLSIFSSGLMLFGFSYLYGLSGTTNLQGILATLDPPGGLRTVPLTLLIAIVMVVAGLGFKITAVPFHFYAPDVYQGTTNGGAALLAFVPKVAGFFALVRLLGLVPFQMEVAGKTFLGGGPLGGSKLFILLWILSVVTMTLGNVMALLQNNLRRLLAYSSIAHAGYMLIGLTISPYLAGNPSNGIEAVLFYLASYGAMTIGTFAIISWLSTEDRPVEDIDDLSGLGKTHPGIALVMTLFMFSLIGMPMTAGFMGKFLLFYDVFTVDPAKYSGDLFWVLALIGAINAAIGAWYYLRVISVMYLRPTTRPLDKPATSARTACVWVCAFFTILLGVYPKLLTTRTREATTAKVKVQKASVDKPTPE